MKPTVGRQVGFGLIFLAAVALVAVVGSLANGPNIDGWYADAEKVPWSPPNVIFAPVWTLLYVMIAVAGWLVWRSGYRTRQSNRARQALWMYVAQLALNGLWSPMFFAGYPLVGEAAWWAALVIIVALIVSVVWFAASAWKHSRAASWMMVPYVVWLAFATTLNAGIIALN